MLSSKYQGLFGVVPSRVQLIPKFVVVTLRVLWEPLNFENVSAL